MTIESTLEYKIKQIGKTVLYTAAGAAIGHSTDISYAPQILAGLGYILGSKEYFLDSLTIANSPNTIQKYIKKYEKAKKKLQETAER